MKKLKKELLAITMRDSDTSRLPLSKRAYFEDDTAYLRFSKKNKERINKSIKQFESGLGMEHELIEPS